MHRHYVWTLKKEDKSNQGTAKGTAMRGRCIICGHKTLTSCTTCTIGCNHRTIAVCTSRKLRNIPRLRADYHGLTCYQLLHSSVNLTGLHELISPLQTGKVKALSAGYYEDGSALDLGVVELHCTPEQARAAAEQASVGTPPGRDPKRRLVFNTPVPSPANSAPGRDRDPLKYVRLTTSDDDESDGRGGREGDGDQ